MGQYTYLLVVGLIVAALDAFGIGANDNANNFANAVASKVVSPKQAILIAAIFEFLGAILVGNNVAEAIRGRIINVNLFRNAPATLQLAMVCALVGSSTWLMLATRMGWPVSTTHSIIGGVLGVGVAAYGSPAVNWEYGSGRGFGGIVASWFISIAVSGAMAAVLYAFMKYAILRYRNSFARSLVFGPIVFGLTYGIMCLSLVWKGTPKLKLDSIPDSDVIAIVLGTWACSAVATYYWVSMPLKRFHWDGEDLQWWHYIVGGFAPKAPLRAGFDVSHQGQTLALWQSDIDDGFLRAEAEAKAFAEAQAAAGKAKPAASAASSAAATPPASEKDLEAGAASAAKLSVVTAAESTGASKGGSEAV